jgi:hypothetical protein
MVFWIFIDALPLSGCPPDAGPSFFHLIEQVACRNEYRFGYTELTDIVKLFIRPAGSAG